MSPSEPVVLRTRRDAAEEDRWAGAPGRIDGVELLTLELSLVEPWVTAHGTLSSREVLLVRVVVDGIDGWGECPAFAEPGYSADYLRSELEVLRRWLVPGLMAGEGLEVKGHHLAKSALELAILDARLKAEDLTLAGHLHALSDAPGNLLERVPAGIAISLAGGGAGAGGRSVEQLVEAVGRQVERGYRNVKVKVEPGWDAEPLAALISAFGNREGSGAGGGSGGGGGVSFGADANGAYAGLADPAGELEDLDSLGLDYLEQPLADDDLVGHADLDDVLATPICLDESVTSLGVLESALALRACSAVSIKAARLGGYEAAVRAHDRAGDEGLQLRCGGLLATGVGRGADVGLGRLPLFSLAGDLSAGDRFFAEDVVVDPIRLGPDGMIEAPRGAGIGVEVRPDLDRWVTGREWVPGRAG